MAASLANPGERAVKLRARREGVALALDYARAVNRWRYDDPQTGAQNARPR